jgi:hypothetical protein
MNDADDLPEDAEYSNNTRPTKQVLDEAYAKDLAAKLLFQVLDQGWQTLPKEFKKLNFRVSLAQVHATGTGSSRKDFSAHFPYQTTAGPQSASIMSKISQDASLWGAPTATSL